MRHALEDDPDRYVEANLNACLCAAYRSWPWLGCRMIVTLSTVGINIAGIIRCISICSWDSEQQMPVGFRPLQVSGRILRPHGAHGPLKFSVRST